MAGSHEFDIIAANAVVARVTRTRPLDPIDRSVPDKEDVVNEKEKRRLKRKQKTSRPKAPTTAALPPELVSPFAMEQVMRSMFGGKRGASADAQELAYEAMEAPDPERALQLAERALAINPRCVDALLLVARATSRTTAELIEHVRAAVRAGEEELGKAFFRQNRGHFWGILETRPYMRARALLAELLAKEGRVDEAVAHYEDLLELNPNDNQGLRYALLGHYLALDRLDDAERMFRTYDDDGSACFAWGRVLRLFLAGEHAAAHAALREAREANRFAEEYLSGRRRLPKRLPGYYGIGDENEGVVCAVELGDAWAKHREAVAWLNGAG